MLRILLLAAAAAVTLVTAGQAAARGDTPDNGPRVVASDSNVVEEVVVRGQPKDWLLSVTVGGDIREESYVDSAPAGLNCGGGYYKYFAKRAATHKCWLRVRHKRTVMLSAADSGRYGVDWTVDWVGCRPKADGALCEVTMTSDVSVGVQYRRLQGS